MNESNLIKPLLSTPKDIVIISHRNPDGDAIGASLGLQSVLKRMMHNVSIVLPSECPPIFDFLEDIKDITVYDLKQDLAKERIARAQIIFCLDFNSLERIDKVGALVAGNKDAKIVMIDHHIDPEPFADFVISDVEASSTAEMVYKFIEEIGQLSKLNVKAGEALFTGIITDTGSFKYSTRPLTYKVASALKELGVDDYALQNNIFNSLKPKHLRLLGHCLANRFELFEEHRAAMIHLTKADYVDFDIQRGDTEGIINYALMIKNVDVAAFITEQPNIIKISLRSKGDINVQKIAAANFNGGGHRNASGGSAYAKLEDILNKWRSLVPTIR